MKSCSKGLYKRGNVWWIRYAGHDGQIRYESAKTHLKREAADLLVQRKREVLEAKEPGRVKRIPKYTFGELCEEYLKWAERQKSYRAKKGYIDQLTLFFGNLPLNQFTTRLVEEYQTMRLTRHDNKPATVNRHLATIKHMFRKAVDWEMVHDEVLVRVRKVKLLPENNRRLRYLTKEEGKRLIEASKAHLKPMVVMALNTGMRKGEILGLQWNQVDLKHGFILLDKTKNNERREIPINAPLKAMLIKIKPQKAVGFVYINNEGKPYGDVKNSFNTAVSDAEIDDFRFHDLRHTFASHLVMAGVDLTTVKELLGHKSIIMTLRYAHLAPSHKVKAVDILAKELDFS